LAALGTRRSGQTGQIEIEQQHLVGKGVLAKLSDPAQRGLVGGTPLGDLDGGGGVERTGDGRLFGKLGATPGTRQKWVAADGGVDLGDDLAAGQ
jgi:hypothetical protein